jgi:hypothetical protein
MVYNSTLQRQHPYPYPGRLNDNYGANGQRLRDVIPVLPNKSVKIFGIYMVNPKNDDRRAIMARKCQQRAKIKIMGNDSFVFLACNFQNIFICRTRGVVVGYATDFVSVFFEKSSQFGRNADIQ